MKGEFFMNSEKNKAAWLLKCQDTLRLGGRTDLTIQNYYYAIRRFLYFFDENTCIRKLSIQDIINFHKTTFLDRNLGKASYNASVSAVRYFYLVCFNRVINKVLLPTSKVRKRYPNIMPRDLFITLVNDELSLKRKCWLLVAFCSGLRISEVASMKIEDIDSQHHRLRVMGKGQKERYTILPDVVIKFLRLYYKEQHFTQKTGYLFIGNVKGHIHKNCIGDYFSDLRKLYNIPSEITFHSLRHSFATFYLMNNGDLFTLQFMMGHKSLASTAVYVHLAQDFNNLKGIKYV